MLGGAQMTGQVSRPSGEGEGAELSGLILRIARDADRDAFAQLFNRFAPRLKAYLMRTGAPAERAEEWVQDTFLSVWRKAGYFDPARAGASTWIYAIARNLRIDAARRDRRIGDLVEDPFEQAADPGAEESLVGEERDARVRRAMTGLSDDQAQVVRLSFFEDRPHSEIAAALGLPLGTVKSRLRLAMARLRAALEDVG